MKVKKIITTMYDVEIDVQEITLLSKDDYLKFKDNIPSVNFWWWLRSSGDYGFDAYCVDYGGGIGGYGNLVFNSDGSVRPALRLNPEFSNLQIKDRFEFGGKSWTVIGEEIALSDEAFCRMAFRRKYWEAYDANNYATSDIKKYLDNWLELVGGEVT